MIDDKLLKSEEKAVFALRSLYRKYGYLPYKMSKFEEYELYIRNKDFLVSDRIITFNDTNGKLMALKPDVTLSIIKSGEDVPGFKQKVYYNENVYRVSGFTRQFQEIMQAGLECIGDIDLYDIYEVISLAAQSMAQISDDFVLEISHLGLLFTALERACTDSNFIRKALGFIAEKNAHDLLKLCELYHVNPAQAEQLTVFIRLYGDRKKVIRGLRKMFRKEELEDMEKLSELLDSLPCSDKIKFDFSVVNDRNYYNGFVFRGFLDGVSGSILAGGQYDNLMRKMERTSGAVGFAVYLDLLEQLQRETKDYDVDILLLYDSYTDGRELAQTVERLTAEGRTVSAQKARNPQLRYREMVDLRKEDTLC